MEFLPLDLTLAQWALCLGTALGAGLVKGIVGFAMPTILIAFLGSLLSPEIALAGLMLPTLLTNALQALRGGWAAARAALWQFRVFMGVGAVALVLAAQLYAFMPLWLLYFAIGGPVALFCLVQIVGWQTRLAAQRPGIEAGVGAFAGVIGGLSGVWGPPTVAYLTALDIDKQLAVRVLGVAFGLGTLVLILAHGPTGVVRGETMAFSAILCAPALLGMALGTAIQDRIDQAMFRRATLWVLLAAGINLLRRSWLAM